MSPGRSSRGLRDYRRGRGHTPGTAGETVLTRLLDTPALQRHFRQSPGGARSARAAAGDHAMNRSFTGHLTWREAAGQRSRRVGEGLGPAVGRCGHSHRALCVIILLVFAGSSAPVPPGGSLPKGVPRRAPQPRPRSPGSPRRRQPAGPCPELSRTASRQIDRLLAGRSFRPQAGDLSGAADAR